MRHSLITLLAVITLLSQWGWLEHGYHDHESGEVCELCVSAAGHVAILPGTTQPLPLTHTSLEPPTPLVSLLSAAPRFYPTRAPPLSL
ncbi:MAG: hypothetical protein OQL08_11185 [Gammaproteobacteria bacterium]|nr:hypothetical protein [Gammaproteobacteria bacterium]